MMTTSKHTRQSINDPIWSALTSLVVHVCCIEVKKAIFHFVLLSLHSLKFMLQNNYH